MKKLLHNSKVSGTHSTYKSQWKAWKKFCKLYNLNKHKEHNQLVYLFFATWRFKTTPNKAKSINKDVTGIISIHNSTKLSDPIDKNKFHLFQDLIKSISRIKGRQSEITYPIRNAELEKMVKKFNSKSYYNLLWKTMLWGIYYENQKTYNKTSFTLV